jgi:hypothetical protein
MKALISQSVVRDSQRFLDKISRELPKGLNSFHITSVGIKKASGYGNYNYFMDVEINGEFATLTKFTHNSWDYDYYNDLEYKSHKFNFWAKQTILNILSTESVFDKLSEIANSVTINNQ